MSTLPADVNLTALLASWGMVVPRGYEWTLTATYRADNDTKLTDFADGTFDSDEVAEFEAGAWVFVTLLAQVHENGKLLYEHVVTGLTPKEAGSDGTLREAAGEALDGAMSEEGL